MNRPPVIPIAHRGASAYAPENTVAAFDEAIRLGAKAVEFDLRLSADNIPVVIHDDTFDRTTNAKGPVHSMHWCEMLPLDAGSWFHPRFGGVRIPSVEEALLAIGPSATPVIELKVPTPPDTLLPLLEKYDLEEDVVILSFEAPWLLEMRKASKKLALGLLADQWRETLPDEARDLSADLLVLHTDILTPPCLKLAHAKSLEVWCFTANDVGMVAACAAMGVTGIITDRPDLIRTR